MSPTTVLVECDLPVPMRDGTCLASDLYRPADGAPCPVLVQRTPYGKSNAPLVGGLIFEPLSAVRAGFAVVVQDVRGCFASEGQFRAIEQERTDGHDTIEWIATQPWCSGSVGVYGSSYMGVTALQAAVDAPPSLRAVFAYLTGSNYHDGWVYSGGAFELAFNLRWTVNQACAAARRAGLDPLRLPDIAAFLDDPVAAVSSRFDVRSLLSEASALVPHWRQWHDHPEYDAYWAGLDVARAVGSIRAPVLHVAGWFDGFLKGHLELQRALGVRGHPHWRGHHRFVVGPWDHEAYRGPRPSSAGSRDFGPGAVGGAAGMTALALGWFRRWLLDDPDTRALPAVRYFVMGSDTWREADRWPPPHTEQRWYLRSDGRAATRQGTGRLTREPPGDEPEDSYLYDPRRPVPTTGGRHLAYGLASAGVQDQAGVEARPDVLVYTSDVLGEPLTVSGPVACDLYVRSSAVRTDFAATLADVGPESSVGVADGLVRVDIGPLEPGEYRRVRVDLWDTAYTFEAGHRLRVQVTSSNFPRFDRNRNAGPEDPPDLAVPALQQVAHDGSRASFLLLTVAEPGGEGPE